MAQKKKRSLMDRFLLGSEKSEGYARASLPSNRWELFWDIFKGSFFKLILVNLLILIFCIPFVALLIFRYMSISSYGIIYPFSQSFGIGYGALPSMVGLSESIVYQTNLMVLVLMPITFLIAAVGISGGAYVIRNMVWTEGIFVANDFWHGIRKNFKQISIVLLIYSCILYFSLVTVALCDLQIETDAPNQWIFVASKIMSLTFIVTLTIMTLHMITMSVTYEVTLRALIKNSFLFTIGLLPQNLFFIVLGLIPYLITLLGQFFSLIGTLIIIAFGVAYFLLIWTDFCQWGYDRFVNDKVPGAQKNKGIYAKVGKDEAASLKEYKKQIALAERSSLSSKPIKPITDDELKIAELPTSFNRADIEKLNQSKQAIYEDHERYVKEHISDPEFQKNEQDIEYEKQQEERQKRIEKAKKELSKRKHDD